ncbi:hypothetical protein RO3G_01886 [Rhizopus delemar RA 99-880]|uniref:Uncharacterized protein n=1 Tax=Rhizopus delemar (strain RA 99-880 / ATCC MYA-4621 / FGSC 9543 / NRRL 43880) TaxID=246409 RepID=I1BLV2_RHIO9|nr:hypothetical protein RO3G_01886 [Rhizopus delemar RA 99-880]|eukprot:EIE77182.1 hypothetical protein RO3G_01886 [Rhizopus delemar RA 99-880]
MPYEKQRFIAGLAMFPNLPLRPDVVVSIVDRLKFGDTLGHGEVKIAEPTYRTMTDFMLCMRSATLNSLPPWHNFQFSQTLKT